MSVTRRTVNDVPGTSPSRGTDDQLRHAVIAELERARGVCASDVGVSARAGAVALYGHVGSFTEQLAARAAAYRVPGVLVVADELAVRYPGQRTDTVIATAVAAALERVIQPPDEVVRAVIRHGVVTLSGTVRNWSRLQQAPRLVEQVSGVASVVSFLVPPE